MNQLVSTSWLNDNLDKVKILEGLNITKEKYYTKMHVLSSPSESLRWGKVIECLIYFAYLD